jgi:hypothetical protein
MSEILSSWNDPLCVIDLSIYTSLSPEKLIEYFEFYRKEFFKEIIRNEDNYTILSNNNNKYNLPEYHISNNFETNYYKDFDFKPLSLIYTDTIFEDRTKKDDELEIVTLMNDKYFLHIKNLRKTLNEDGIPHYVVIDLLRSIDTKPTQFLIGGLNKQLEPVFNKDNFDLYFKHLFTMDEWFFKTEKK